MIVSVLLAVHSGVDISLLRTPEEGNGQSLGENCEILSTAMAAALKAKSRFERCSPYPPRCTTYLVRQRQSPAPKRFSERRVRVQVRRRLGPGQGHRRHRADEGYSQQRCEQGAGDVLRGVLRFGGQEDHLAKGTSTVQGNGNGDDITARSMLLGESARLGHLNVLIYLHGMGWMSGYMRVL